MTTTTELRPAAPPRVSGNDLLETLAGGEPALLVDGRVAPLRSFVTAIDERALGDLASACAEPVLVRDGAEPLLPDGIAVAAVQLARLAGGNGEASLALVEDHDELPELPAITLAGIGRLLDDDAQARASLPLG